MALLSGSIAYMYAQVGSGIMLDNICLGQVHLTSNGEEEFCIHFYLGMVKIFISGYRFFTKIV